MTFSTVIKILGSNPYVAPPTEVLHVIFQQAKKKTSPISVKGKLNGAPFQKSLVRYQGEWRLYINGQMAKNSKLPFKGSVVNVVGQKVVIELLFDQNPPMYEIVPALKAELDKNEQAKKAFEHLPRGRKKEICRYLGSLKSKDAVDRNVTRVIHHLLGEKTDALYALMHRKKEDALRG
ncbi:hypothetical protein C5B42_04410 [Candidatus Cerribacteria bacterium 'Amazon FNV 2010 28 9']|uniref:DUF1905 domain-containing protein n=1 Tax=Candidatus Cerribacteria bacterium 'Amazon FNV 2010 28 9' TaxID=2081795 RepID=A0A317JP82_9BACT|nr:MAG: hypothetical protein C5B42_04410 [Candidatus Cerribacteria bacterium 'Amazon FNV 2010 28 9']